MHWAQSLGYFQRGGVCAALDAAGDSREGYFEAAVAGHSWITRCGRCGCRRGGATGNVRADAGA